jgi:hypothetical protein
MGMWLHGGWWNLYDQAAIYPSSTEAEGSYDPMCIDKCIGMCTDMCIGMRIDICIGMCIDICIGMCIPPMPP